MPIRKDTLTALIVSCAAPFVAIAQQQNITLSAVCKDPQGYLISYQDMTGKPQSGKDGFRNAAWSFQWSTSNPGTGKVITQDSQAAGGGTHAADAAVIYSPDLDSITFFVKYETGLWFYTLYPKSQNMVASRHMISPLHKGGSAAVFSTKCDMGVQ